MLTRLRGAAMFVVACLAVSISPLSAQDATPTTSDLLLPPDAEVAGLDLGEWSVRQWQWFLSFPEASNPIFDDTGERCGFGQSGPVFFLAGSALGSVERSCTVPEGVDIFVPLGGAECSTIEPEPFFGRDEAELRECADEAIEAQGDYYDQVTLTVDGESVGSIQDYRASSPMGTFVLPEGNIFGGPANVVAGFVADGYQAFLSPLSVGEHEIVVSDPQVSVTYRLTIAAPETIEPEASPEASPAA